MSVKLKTITPEAEATIVEIARVSSSRQDKSEEQYRLIKYLIDHKHWSPFEHGYMTVDIHTTKAIGIQLLRHRSFTFQEFSQRYAKVEGLEDIEFRQQAEHNRQSSTNIIGEIYSPTESVPAFEAVSADNEASTEERTAWMAKVAEHLGKSVELYGEGIDLGVAKECARFILPMATTTRIFMTGSIRSWVHFLMIRDDSHAQKEAQQIARQIKNIFIKELPLISEALSWKN